MLKIYTDAAFDPSSGAAGIGIVITGDAGYEQIARPLDGLDWDNHLAEMEALVQALEYVVEAGWADQLTFVFSDSEIAVKVFERGHTKNDKYLPYLARYQELEPAFAFLTLDWVSERANQGADRLARQGLRQALKD